MTTNHTIDQWISRAAMARPDHVAIIFDNTPISYAQMSAEVAMRAGQLQSAGLGHGDRVLWYGMNDAEVFVLLFACARLGAMLVPVNWRLSPSEIIEIIEDCSPKLLIHDDHFSDAVAAMVSDGSLACLSRKAGDLPKSEPELVAGADTGASLKDQLLIIYTSGSTGRPKGVVLAQEAIVANAEMSIDAHHMTADDRVLNVLPLFHVGGLNILPTPAFSLGATVVLHSGFDPAYCLAAMVQVELMIVVPTVLKRLMDEDDWADADLSKLRVLSIGSTDVPVDLITAMHKQDVPVVQIYGATETAPFAIYQKADEAFDTVGSIGRAGISCDIALRKPDGSDAAIGEAGEICVRGRNILTSYWRDDALTTAMIKDGWFHTGDVARLDEDGLYWFMDRIKHVIISGGENVYPAEVERVLRLCPGVVEVAVVGCPDTKWGEVPVAVIVSQGGLDSDDVLKFMQGRLARYKQPRSVVFVDALPRNAMNKVVAADVRRMIS